MVQQQPEPILRAPTDHAWHVSGRLVLDVAGGASLIIDVPHEPAHRAADGPGRTATIKLWTRASHEATPVPAFGAPDAVRTEPTPCSIEMPGSPIGTDAPAYYAVAIRVFVDLTEVDQWNAVFDARTGEEIRHHAG